MPLLTLDDAYLAFTERPVLDHVRLRIDPQERICLIGHNGAGKSTLMKVLNGELELEAGILRLGDGVRVGYLTQEVPAASDETVYDIVAEGLEELGDLLKQYHHAAMDIAHEHTEAASHHLSELQHEIEAQDGWRSGQWVDTVISRLDLEADAPLKTLSGGYRRRAMLARALVREPDILLLDEPTNHLDIASIQWLESALRNYKGSVVFITHDRTFLQNLATRIVELDRGQLTSWPGDYRTYLQRKEAWLEAEEKRLARFDKKLSQEEEWIRKGIKARRRRNMGRVRALEALREKRRQRRERPGIAQMDVERGAASGRIVVDVRHISKAYGNKKLIDDFSATIIKGDRIGIVGPNGAGKSTLIKILLGELKADAGQVVSGSRIEAAYFDQNRELLDPEKTVLENLNRGSMTVTVNGRTRHIIGYLREFLFPPEQVEAPVKTLSGGERNRLLLARLFTRSANLLVLDEPTNDLDVDTLEMLEDLLSRYDGTLLIVSHDRAFLDNVVTGLYVFEGDGRIEERIGSYDEWVKSREAGEHRFRMPGSQSGKEQKASPERKQRADKNQKLSYREQRELQALPQEIEVLEQEQLNLQQVVSDATFYQGDKKDIAETLARLKDLDQELEKKYDRWELLSARE